MKKAVVTVKFPEGLHARPASRLVRLCGRFRSQILLRKASRLVSGRSLLSILLLAVACNAQLEVMAAGDDEDAAIQAVEGFFQQANGDSTLSVSDQGAKAK